MANVLGALFGDIANAIREKSGETATMKPVEFPDKIRAIESGGGLSADVRYVTFMSHDGTVEYGKKAVAVGDDCADPVARGLFGTPTREGTAQYSYTFYGWAATPNGGADANWNKSITEDKTVYANFAAAVRYYTIRYYDGDTLLKSESLAYGTTPEYTAKKAGYDFVGWTPEIVPVAGNADYYAQWKELSGFDRLLGLSVTNTFDAAINNAGSLLAVAAGSSDTRDPVVYNISGDSPERLVSNGTGTLIWRGVSFSFDDTELHVEGYSTGTYAHSVRTYTIADPPVLTYSYQSLTNGNKPIEDSPVADTYGYYMFSNGSKLIQAPGATINLDGSANSIAYSPDGVHVAVGTGDSASIYNAATGELVNKVYSARANKVSYNSDGSLLAVSCNAAPYVAIYETAGYTKKCDLADRMTAVGYAELIGDDTLVIGTDTTVLVYTVTESGLKDFEYNVPVYEGASIKDVVKNHCGTRVVFRSTDAVEVWAKS